MSMKPAGPELTSSEVGITQIQDMTAKRYVLSFLPFFFEFFADYISKFPEAAIIPSMVLLSAGVIDSCRLSDMIRRQKHLITAYIQFLF